MQPMKVNTNIFFYLYSLEDVHKHVAEHLEAWEEVFQSDTPHLAQFPEPYSTLEGINRLALIKCLRPDKIILAVQVSHFHM